MAHLPSGRNIVTNTTLQRILNSDVALIWISIDMDIQLSTLFVISDGKFLLIFNFILILMR